MYGSMRSPRAVQREERLSSVSSLFVLCLYCQPGVTSFSGGISEIGTGTQADIAVYAFVVLESPVGGIVAVERVGKVLRALIRC